VTEAPPVAGRCDARFAGVRDAFRRNFAEHDEIGAAVCIRVEGRVVVDLWGGHREPERRRPWREDTLVNAYSVGKGVVSLLALVLVERGLLELDAPLAGPWPDLAAEGKGALTLRQVLSHRAGLPSVREPLPDGAVLDWERMCAALAGQRPFWPPGERHGYHVNTFGFLVGEAIRRASGRRVGEALRREVCGPIGADFHFGLPADLHGRVATMLDHAVAPRTREQWERIFPATGDAERDLMVWHAYFNPPDLSGVGRVNSAAWRSAEVPSANGHATARAVAAIYQGLLDDRWLSPSLRAEAVRIHADGEDAVLGRPSRFGLGFQLAQPTRPLGPNPGAFGHYGHGGSLGFADPEAGVAFGYLMNRPGVRWQTPRTDELVRALYDALGVAGSPSGVAGSPRSGAAG
jgi:CubicO group peptidase (beta-lactamase class C family)